MKLRNYTGGCCRMDSAPMGLFWHDGQLYVNRGKKKMIRCADGAKVVIYYAASIYPVELDITDAATVAA